MGVADVQSLLWVGMVYVSGNILERAGKRFLVSSDMRLLVALMFIFGRTGGVGRGLLKRYFLV